MTSSNFQKANEHITQFHTIQKHIQISGFIVRLAKSLPLKITSFTSKFQVIIFIKTRKGLKGFLFLFSFDFYTYQLDNVLNLKDLLKFLS